MNFTEVKPNTSVKFIPYSLFLIPYSNVKFVTCSLFKSLLLIWPFSRKEAFAITHIIRIAKVDVANHNCDIVVVVNADGDPLVHFKSAVTY